MSRTLVPLGVVGILLTCAVAAALERGLHLQSARQARQAATAELEEAIQLADRHPTAFGARAGLTGESPLKSLAQESAARRQLTIAFLSESDRDVERGRKERQVLVRLAQPVHGNLVRFLDDLEGRGAGTRIREIHLRPSERTADGYEEAEIVVVRSIIVDEGAP